MTEYKYLDKIDSPEDLKKIPVSDLPKLADEIRDKLICVVSERGGHLASSLGAVELIIALHYVLDAPKDFLIWDVGHQAYAHKLLTGRNKKFDTLRELGGISGFPSKDESIYDPFTVGHSATSISLATGVKSAFDLKKEKRFVVAVIGDASLGGGEAFEALNHAGHMKKNIIVVLNDNERSISKSVGALSKYLNKIIAAPLYNKVRREAEDFLKNIPKVGDKAVRAARKFEEGIKNLLVPGILFEEMGFRYFGPIDGHNIGLLIKTLKNVMPIEEPILIHILTKKGKGCSFAENAPEKFHSCPPFDMESGEVKPRPLTKGEEVLGSAETFTEAFGKKIAELADSNKKIVAVSAAMPDGTGLKEFAKKFPDRFFDVGIAEEHAVTFASALAKGGLKPVIAIYSTFLQRSYDQIIHDVALQNQNVLFALDRAGLVGEDGPTHHGLFDIAYMRAIPNMVVSAPKDERELEKMLELGINYSGPFSIRYPRGSSGNFKYDLGKPSDVEIGKSEILRHGKDIAIFALGNMVYLALEVSEFLKMHNIDAAVINARFVKPLDGELLEDFAHRVKRFVAIEDGVVNGGFGSAVLEFIAKEGLDVKAKLFGLPNEFIEHGKKEELLKKYNLMPESIGEIILKELFNK